MIILPSVDFFKIKFDAKIILVRGEIEEKIALSNLLRRERPF